MTSQFPLHTREVRTRMYAHSTDRQRRRIAYEPRCLGANLRLKVNENSGKLTEITKKDVKLEVKSFSS